MGGNASTPDLRFTHRELVLLDAALNTYLQVLRCSPGREPAVLHELYRLKGRLEQLVERSAVA